MTGLSARTGIGATLTNLFLNRKELARLSHDGAVKAVAFSPDGTRLATASDDGTARVWPWRAEDLIRIGCSLLPRNLTSEEWKRYLGEEAYRPTCPNLPVPKD